MFVPTVIPSIVLSTADKDGDYYILNGSKMFTTNAGIADTFVVFALTDKSKGPKGMRIENGVYVGM